jgi:hypothetical protein
MEIGCGFRGNLYKNARVSIGPRLFSRGDVDIKLAFKESMEFQLGHDFSAMEMAAIFRLLLISKNWPFSRGTPTNVELFTKCVSHHRSNRYWGTLRAHPGPPGTT